MRSPPLAALSSRSNPPCSAPRTDATWVADRLPARLLIPCLAAALAVSPGSAWLYAAATVLFAAG